MARIVALIALSAAALLAVPAVAWGASAADRYIVVLEEQVRQSANVAERHDRRFGARVSYVYRNTISGYAARIRDARVQDVRSDPRVAYLERDVRMEALAETVPWGISRIGADVSSTVAGDGPGAVTGVNAYVIDTGIDTNHADLRVVRHVNFAGGRNRDCNGHGTHVAGTLAARDNATAVVGAAPGMRLTGVKVLDCAGEGFTSRIIKDVDWVTANAPPASIANMSLGGSASQALDDAVTESVASGIFYSVAAGNEAQDACNVSPARVGPLPGLMTVAATDQQDGEASFSNFGDCVDVWAPGVATLSTKRGGGVTAMSGTSMAAPHVGGTAALFLLTNFLSEGTVATPAGIEAAIAANAQGTGTFSQDGAPITRDYAGDF